MMGAVNEDKADLSLLALLCLKPGSFFLVHLTQLCF